MSAVLLALLASLAWGTSDFLAGVESRRTTFWAAVLISQPAALVGALIVLAVHGQGPPSLSSLWPPLLAGILSALAAFSQYRALTLVPMSLVSPLFAAAAVVPVAWGVARGERPGVIQAAGVALTLVGIVLISRQGCEKTSADPSGSAADPPGPGTDPPETTAISDPAAAIACSASVCSAPAGMLASTAVPAGIVPAVARNARVCAVPAGMTPASARRAGILLSLASGVGFGLLLIAFDYSSDADEYWTVSAARFTAVLMVLATIGLKRPQLHLRRASVPVLVLVGLLVVIANVLFTTASTRGYLSVVAVLGWLSPAFTVVFARTFLHERLRPLQWFAAVLVFAGVVCLATG